VIAAEQRRRRASMLMSSVRMRIVNKKNKNASMTTSKMWLIDNASTRRRWMPTV
jgi:hypothetical protein